MADAVPVCDALCEAIEYLSRLGSNLRVRSENFKQKKLRKDRLRNTHAVQKAANKVLLICELSKKSILNVEDGVKQILTQIDTAQGSNKFKKNVHKSTKNIVYEYFEYDSQMLKIRNKINLKHFTSVKVVTKAMPPSMQDNYPLYYVCNLYHLREKRDKQKCDHQLTEIEMLNNSSNEDEECLSSINSSKKSDDNINNCEVADKSNNIEKSDSAPTNEKGHVENTGIRKKSSLIKNKKYKHIKVVDDDSSDSNYNVDNLQTNEKIIPINDAANTESVDASSTNKEINMEVENRQESSNLEDTSVDAPAHVTREENTSKLTSARNTEENKKNAEDVSLDRTEKIDTDMIDTNKKEDQMSSHSDKDTNESKIEISNSNTHAEKCANTSLLNDFCTVSNVVSNTNIAIESKSEVKSISDDNSCCSTESKPLIKCVNINKLLKKDKIPKTRHSVIELIDSDTDDEMTVKNKKHRHIKKNKKYESKRKSLINLSLLSLIKCTKDSNTHRGSNPRICDEEDFSEKKRKELKNFKMKQFTVNIVRMPKLTEQFLYKYGLNRIIQNGSPVCQIPFENGGTRLKQYKSNAQHTLDLRNSQNEIKEVNVVKSALLNDSESDCERETGKKALLHESDSLEQQQKAKSADSGDDKNFDKIVNKDNQRSATPSEQESQNNNDSSDTNTESRKRKRKSRNSTFPLASKRKRIMKSVNAKNMLLNCTLSSDTEDEEVKGVLKNIKNSLLKEESDNDIEIKQKSDSDGEVTKSNQDQSNSECDISTKDTNSQENTEVNSDNNSEIVRNEIKNIEKSESDGSEDDKNSKKRDKEKRKSEIPSEQESEHNNDSLKSPVLFKRKCIKNRQKYAKKNLLNSSSSSDTEDEGGRNALRNMKDSILKGESDEDIEKKSGSDGEITKSNTSLKSQDRSNSECDISTKGTSSQGNEVDTNSSSKKMGRSKSDGSSSQSSDTQESYEKDIDRLTNLKTLTKKRRLRRRRRRRSTSSDHSQSTSSNSVNKMPKVPLISEEGFLKAESSSDAASLADSDVGEEVEIPAVSMSGLNGDSIDHLAKEDLLEESNSSDSHEKSSNDIKKEDESEEDNVKSKRRKANAISSDSEAGGSRRKNRGVKLSDFEDSEDDFEATKKSKRKKKSNDSDASVSSSIDGSKKKRRRIKHVDDSEDASGSESETEGRNKHGRKNIRKVMGKNQLEEATKKAAREEKERIARIAERQKLYNNLQFDESGKPDEVVLDKVVLDFDPETKEPLIEVDKGLVKKLKPHQANGIKFMWDACFESAKRIKKDKGSGCILAHCMGLGKTLQVVSLTHTLLTHGALTGVRRVLVVCPLSTVLNWVNEFGIWLKHSHADYEVDVYELSRHKQNSERAWQLQQWFSGGGVCVLGYEMFRNLSADNSKKFKKKMLKSFQESLVDPGPDLVVCDEGHLLKNEKTSLSQAMNRVKTLRRIVLTGTPLQNNLKEYYCMVQFVKPNLLGKYNEYLNRFVNPITNGQYTDSTEHDIRVMKRRSHVLHKMLDGAVQRRDYGVLAPFLPPKHEYVLFITLSEVQIKLYEHYLDNYSRRPLPGKSSGFLFPDFQSLQRIWTHPLVLKYNSERYEIMQQKKREREEEDSEGSIADFIDDDSTPDESSTEESTDSLSDMSDDSRKKSKKKKSAKKSKGKDTKITTRRGTRANPIEADDDDVILEDEVQAKSENPTEWWMSLVTEDELDDLRHSHKLVLLFDILRQCETIGDKLLVFSQSLYSLDLIEHFLGKVDEATQEARVDEKLNGHVGSWSPGVDYFRLDGSTSCENRSIWCKNFNREDNPRARLFLISTRAGGLGINLVAANRVVIFDVSWNPSHDVQSIFRVYRFGQKKPCYIYRFLAMGTMEEKIYERQVTKQAISKRVIDEQQIDRHYAENDLAELYKFEPRPPAPRELPPLPKDRLFAEMLREHEAQIYKYHEHDSLLENKEEETLTEEERKAAWEDFENEKTRPPPAPFSAYMHNGMMPGLLQQQQQLAYATFAALLHKEMPNASDAQIREALYRSNPALLQKMGELYKYAQPGMMNPAMMNPAMNAAGGMALGGSSGLQYEPPWQRQQQMRMQQLLQQNQQMGAKFYAGGLGSRDPVAMALQQQRAREMMLGERGRSRGRPRHDAAPPVALAPTDVVNLDSD